ncbi:Uncharacterised protein [Pseudomonas fluorescens]|uniref:Uncharacterized protein n=1 Tax=Pseudomonas fluorescens TaxID=294 RepID=A0A3S4P9H0_PSEFL|nr:hypothetical protein [Pseudomonas fluorescens]VEF11909.1 Uncharacterised protein [Pseudomonas fluorescens]
MSRPPRGIARFDSAAAMVQALAAALHDKAFTSPSQSTVMDRLMLILNALPSKSRELIYAFGGMAEGIGEGQARRLDIEAVSEWVAGQYPDRQYPAAFIGSSNGAMIHLAAAMKVPWLPQTFLCPVRAFGNDPDDAQRAFQEGLGTVANLLEADARIAVHHMHDPNQDRLMLQQMTYFRIKLQRLPLAYREFLLRNLPQGATLYVNRCNRQWPVTRTGKRSIFQFGATGGATEAEYFSGSLRIADYLARYNIPRTHWEPPKTTELAPEAEWGFDPALLEDLKELAEQRQWHLVEISYVEPEALSIPTAEIYRQWYGEQGVEAKRLLVGSFLLCDPHTTLSLRAIPLWLLFGVEPSAELLERYLAQAAGLEEVDLMLFSHGTEGVGLATMERWRQALGRAKAQARLIGVDPRRYPRDFATFTRFAKDLQRLKPRFDPPPPMNLDFFEQALQRHGEAWGIKLQTLSGNEP